MGLWPVPLLRPYRGAGDRRARGIGLALDACAGGRRVLRLAARGRAVSAPAQVIEFPTARGRPARLLTLTEVREELGYSERWWRYRLVEGLPRHKWGGGLRFNLDEVKDWLEAHYAA
jgi:hypothetical protein